jgi:hypothetical protein
MTSLEFLALVDRVSAILTENNRFVQTVNALAATWDQLAGPLLGTLPGNVQPQLDNVLNKVRNDFALAVNQIFGLGASVLIPGANKFREDIQEILPEFKKVDPGLIGQLPATITAFTGAFDAVIAERGKNDISAANFFRIAIEIRNALASIRGNLEFARRGIAIDRPVPQGHERLFIQVSCAPEFPRVTDKLSALFELYSELCRLAKQSDTQSPLIIERLELGSPLSIVVTGGQLIILVLADMLRRACEYLYREFTAEGELASVPRDAEAFEAVIKVRDLLVQRGIDPSVMDANLQAAAAKLSTKLNALVGRETFLKVNEQEYSLSHAGQPGLPGSEKRALPDAREGKSNDANSKN